MLKILSTLVIGVPLILLTAVAVSAFLAWPVQLLYNYLAPGDLWDISFKQAWALSALCGLLFKSNVK